MENVYSGPEAGNGSIAGPICNQIVTVADFQLPSQQYSNQSCDRQSLNLAVDGGVQSRFFLAFYREPLFA
jgi:hypothetical protein